MIVNHPQSVDVLFPSPRSCCSDFDLDRLVAGDLDDNEASALRDHLASSRLCASRFEDFARAADVFAAPAPAPRPHASARVPPAQTPARTQRRWTAGLAASAAIAACTVLFVVMQSPPSPRSTSERTKGGDDVEVYALRDGVGARVNDGDAASAGDLLRFVVVVARPRVVAVTSVDGAGTISIFARPTLVAAGRTELAGAVELDDVRGREAVRAHFCDADGPDAAAPSEDALRSLSGPAQCETRIVVTMEKE